MQHRTASLTSLAGPPIHVRIWTPDEGQAKGAFILVHGLGEHAGRYAYVAEHFTRLGFAVYGHDHHGFGKSGGRKGDIPSFQVLVQDTLAVQALAQGELENGGRTILLGHSMGGLIALVLLHDHPRAFGEAIISAPAVNASRGVNAFLLGLAKGLRVVIPGIRLDNGLNTKELCTDGDVVKAYENDPLVHRKISPRLFLSMVSEGRRLFDSPHLFSEELSVLLMHGGDDPITFADDTERLHDLLEVKRKEMKVWPGMLHEILNEREKDKVLAAIDSFFALG